MKKSKDIKLILLAISALLIVPVIFGLITLVNGLNLESAGVIACLCVLLICSVLYELNLSGRVIESHHLISDAGGTVCWLKNH